MTSKQVPVLPSILIIAAIVAVPLLGGLFNRTRGDNRQADAQPVQFETLEPGSLVAILSETVGQVRVKQPTVDDFAEAGDGTVVFSPGKVMTLEKSQVRLDLSNGDIIRLGEKSLFTLEGEKEIEDGFLAKARLDLGKLWAILSGGRLEIETPSGVATVRGSYLSVEIFEENGQPVVKVTCLEGECSLGNEHGAVSLVAGETAVITNVGLPPQTGTMDATDVAAWLAANPEATVVIPALTETARALGVAGSSADPEGIDAPDPTATNTPQPTQTEAPGLRVISDGLCYTGPGDDYEVVGTVFAGTSAVVVGQGASGEYWVIEMPGSGQLCWISGNHTSANGAAQGAPVYIPGPKPTATEEPPPADDPDPDPAPAAPVLMNASGPMGITITVDSECLNSYQVDAVHVAGIASVLVLAATNDPSLSASTLTALNYVGGSTWSRNISQNGIAEGFATIYWRFVAQASNGQMTYSPVYSYDDSFGCGYSVGGIEQIK